MPPELPPDDDDDHELLDKVDALLKRHQPKRYVAPPEPMEAFEFTPQLEPAAPPEYTPLPEFTEPPPAAIAEQPDSAISAIPADDDIPVLTDIVGAATDAPTPANMPASDKLLLDLEDRLYREIEAHIAPQLSMAFGKALNELLSQAKIQVSVVVREHLARELHKLESGK